MYAHLLPSASNKERTCAMKTELSRKLFASLSRRLADSFVPRCEVRTHREISDHNCLISRVCTTLAVNEFLFFPSPSSLFPLFPPVQIQTTSRPHKPAKNHLNHLKPAKNHITFFATISTSVTNHLNHLFGKKQKVHRAVSKQSAIVLPRPKTLSSSTQHGLFVFSTALSGASSHCALHLVSFP